MFARALIVVAQSLALACGLVAVGCATYADTSGKIRGAFYANDLDNAARIAAEAVSKRDRNADVLGLDGAVVLLAAGQPKQAEQTLRKVRDRFDELSNATFDGSAISYVTDDQRRAYAGEDYERILVRAYLALANLFHDGGDVEAYTLQMIDEQERIIAAGALPPEKNTATVGDQPQEQPTNPKAGYPRVAFAPYLRGVLREATHVDYDDAERSYVAVVNWQPNFAYGKTDLQRAVGGHHSERGNGVLYVFALTGHGPFKQEAVEVPSSVSLLLAGTMINAFGSQTVPPSIAPVKVPALLAQENGVAAMRVSIGGRPVGDTAVVTDVTGLAIAQYQAVYPQIVARAVARRCVKKGLIYGTKEGTGINGGSLPGLAMDLAGVAWEATEAADTRCWSLLPDKIQVMRVELPAGEYDIGLQPVFVDGRPGTHAAKQRIAIRDGDNTYMLGHFPDGRLVGNVLVRNP